MIISNNLYLVHSKKCAFNNAISIIIDKHPNALITAYYVLTFNNYESIINNT